MGLFDKFKKKENNDWENAYVGNPNFYNGKDGKPFGAFALTEDTLTSFPKNPRLLYKVDNTEVDEWKLVLVSTTNNGVLGDIDYYEAIKYINKMSKNELIEELIYVFDYGPEWIYDDFIRKNHIE